MIAIVPGKPALVLAPMEGVTDAPMRALQGESGAFAFAVSEFLRVSHEIPPPKVFFRHIPELSNFCRTPTGMPVQVQLLGGNSERMAATAALACELGARGIDINFGCPAPTVNRHDGGATLLKYPDRIREIVAAVRAAVPASLPVSAKLRLGWDDMEAIHNNADMAAAGGASWITIHGRTKFQGYTPPAYWRPIGEVRRRLGIPVVANGEIWTLEDFERCREQTGCEHFMLGRGALADPTLALRILGKSTTVDWPKLLTRFGELSALNPHQNPGYVVRRMKQWLKFAHLKGNIAWFDHIKRCDSVGDLLAFAAR